MTRRNSAPKERFEAIEILLLWEGRVSRSRLLDLFNIHETLASRDIAGFRAEYPDACEPDSGSKSYVGSWSLRPTLTRGTFDEYQRLIGVIGSLDAVSAGVAVESIQVDATSIRHPLFAQIHRAMRLGRCIRVLYRSMSNPEAHERVIRPHSLIQTGPRWHIRAYCSKAEAFCDLNLGRISAVSASEDADLPGQDRDVDWHRIVAVRLVPHRDLSAEQARMVREEYMGGYCSNGF
ncbi:WYL domain-containing protein [Pseudomonas palleroniana]|uniref:WYL domain-containing protein n=1 Tax=Pseudomonas palleroniana TaxID=191390 RepID=UPI003CC80B8F